VHDAMQGRYLVSSHFRPFHLFVSFPQVGVVPKRLILGSCKQRPGANDLYKIPMGSAAKGAPNAGGIGKNCVLLLVEKSGSDASTPKIYVHLPQWSSSTMVDWRNNTRCHRQRRWLITVTVKLTSSRLVVQKSVDDSM